MKKNILILSAGSRNKIVRYFKEALGEEGEVIAADCSNLAPALYDAHRFYLVPRISAPDYWDTIFQLCRKENITAVFSLLEAELESLGCRKEQFHQMGITVVISSKELVALCRDKYRMAQTFLELGISTAKCYVNHDEFVTALTNGEITYPVFVKPNIGCGSIGIGKADDEHELKLMCGKEDYLIQEYMDGEEFGADVYVDLISKKCTSIFVKKKLRMRAGETDKSISVKDEVLFALIRDMAEKLGFCGMIDIDIFKVNEAWYFSEINPRFGGGYPHAHACGINIPKYILNNIKGIENPVTIGDYKEGVCAMKYSDVIIKDIAENAVIW